MKKGIGENKEYIKKYEEYDVAPEDKGIQDYYTWEFAMSRLNSNSFTENIDPEKEKKAYTDAVDKSNFIFSLPKDLIPHIKTFDIKDKNGNEIYRDVDFFSKIILPLHFDNTSLSLTKNIDKYLSFLYIKTKPDRPRLDTVTLEKRYFVYGWEYPRKITQIAFASIALIFLFFVYFCFKNLRFIFSLEDYILKKFLVIWGTILVVCFPMEFMKVWCILPNSCFRYYCFLAVRGYLSFG